MNGFLVVLACDADDVPIRLYDAKAPAHLYAKSLDAESAEVAAAARIMYADAPPAAIAVKVVEFRNGLPVAAAVIKSYLE